MRRSKILRPLLTITFVIMGSLSPASAQTLSEIKKGFLCAPKPEADKRNTEARAGCIECDAQVKNSKIEENLKPMSEIVQDLKQESEKDRLVREMTTLNLLNGLARETCAVEERVKKLENAAIIIEKIISFIEKNQPDFKNIFNDEIYTVDTLSILLSAATSNLDYSTAKPIFNFASNNKPQAFNQIPENIRGPLVHGFKSSYKDILVLQKRELPNFQKWAAIMRACHDAAKKINGIPNINEPEKMTLKEVKEAHALNEQISYVGFQNRDRPSASTCGLTLAEDYALFEYSGRFYQRINLFLRTGTDLASPPMSKEEAEAYTITLNKGLAKLRNYKGVVNRGSRLDESTLKEYEPGKIVTHTAYTSTSRDSGFGGNVRFVIQSKTGKYIAPLSASISEEEVLFSSNTRFLVKSKVQLNPDKMQIELEEVVE